MLNKTETAADVIERMKGQYSDYEIREIDPQKCNSFENSSYDMHQRDYFKVVDYELMDEERYDEMLSQEGIIGDRFCFFYQPGEIVLVIIVDPTYYPIVPDITSIPDPTDRNLAEALYIVNKKAKEARDEKTEYFNQGDYTEVYACKSKELGLYAIKDAAIRKLEKESRAKKLTIHVNAKPGQALALYRLDDFTFHLPIDDEISDEEVQKTIDTIPAKMKRNDISLSFDQALKLLVDFTQISDDQIDVYREENWKCVKTSNCSYSYDEYDEYDEYDGCYN